MITPTTGKGAGSPAPLVIEDEDAAVPGNVVSEVASDTISEPAEDTTETE